MIWSTILQNTDAWKVKQYARKLQTRFAILEQRNGIYHIDIKTQASPVRHLHEHFLTSLLFRQIGVCQRRSPT